MYINVNMVIFYNRPFINQVYIKKNITLGNKFLIYLNKRHT